MTYLPKNSDTEDDPTEQNENLDVRIMHTNTSFGDKRNNLILESKNVL